MFLKIQLQQNRILNKSYMYRCDNRKIREQKYSKRIQRIMRWVALDYQVIYIAVLFIH